MAVSLKNSAYYAVSATPAEAISLSLHFDNRNKTFADHRVLVVPIPKVPVIRAAYRSAGAELSRAIIEQALEQTPTDDELNKMHFLGLYLLSAAMNANKNSVLRVWTEKEQGDPEIMVAVPYMIRKLSATKWLVGHYDYESEQFIPLSPKKSLQEASDALCDCVGWTRIDLEAVGDRIKVAPFLDRRAIKSAYRVNAKKLQRTGWKNPTKTLSDKFFAINLPDATPEQRHDIACFNAAVAVQAQEPVRKLRVVDVRPWESYAYAIHPQEGLGCTLAVSDFLGILKGLGREFGISHNYVPPFSGLIYA
jgi:hypothetical protein